MPSDTRNVRVGVCKVFFDNYDLGYTKGGVEVEVKTESYVSEVDQFGKTPISEVLQGRVITAKVPMAETQIENMVPIMPGATLVQTGGTRATGTVTIATQPTAGQTIVINGVTITFRAAPVNPALAEVLIGATTAATASNLQAYLASSQRQAFQGATYSVATNAVTITYRTFGTEGNAFTIATGTAGASVTVSGATLTGGVASTAKRVDVTDSVGTNLLTVARELRLHPVDKADDDRSDDFVIPLAATAGALQFAYKLEDERVFNVEFKGYPDPTTRRLYYVGN